jgi:hypothetical protein
MEEKNLIIPNIECMTEEQFRELTKFLDSCPVEYEIWEKE